MGYPRRSFHEDLSSLAGGCVLLLLLDVALFAAAYAGAYLVRFDLVAASWLWGRYRSHPPGGRRW